MIVDYPHKPKSTRWNYSNLSIWDTLLIPNPFSHFVVYHEKLHLQTPLELQTIE